MNNVVQRAALLRHGVRGAEVLVRAGRHLRARLLVTNRPQVYAEVVDLKGELAKVLVLPHACAYVLVEGKQRECQGGRKDSFLAKALSPVQAAGD